ncbi:MAG TPA: bacterial proteasome activator family protein [Marmoricola sp.]|nr:bacterial proteasome activator family protein [Marmoricola sp.]
MSTQQPEQPQDPRIMIIDPQGSQIPGQAGGGDDDEQVTELVEEPAKVMRIGSMIRMLLEEVKAAPVDEAGRSRLAGVLRTSIGELKEGLAPELGEELDRLIEPFSEETPSESELRIAQAQLVGWLEGLFHGIQTAIYAQQMAARAQLEQMRRALPPGAMPHAPQDGAGQDGDEQANRDHSGGMYL